VVDHDVSNALDAIVVEHTDKLPQLLLCAVLGVQVIVVAR
jgi:hypothetical protein